jgi:hypothetical protein
MVVGPTPLVMKIWVCIRNASWISVALFLIGLIVRFGRSSIFQGQGYVINGLCGYMVREVVYYLFRNAYFVDLQVVENEEEKSRIFACPRHVLYVREVHHSSTVCGSVMVEYKTIFRWKIECRVFVASDMVGCYVIVRNRDS